MHDIFLIFKSNICTEFIVHPARIQVTSPDNMRPTSEIIFEKKKKEKLPSNLRVTDRRGQVVK